MASQCKQYWRTVPLMAEMHVVKSTLWAFGLLKQAATLDVASWDTCQSLKPLWSLTYHCEFTPATISLGLKFRLETNSTLVWLYAGGVSLILPDVQFGMVFSRLD